MTQKPTAWWPNTYCEQAVAEICQSFEFATIGEADYVFMPRSVKPPPGVAGKVYYPTERRRAFMRPDDVTLQGTDKEALSVTRHVAMMLLAMTRPLLEGLEEVQDSHAWFLPWGSAGLGLDRMTIGIMGHDDPAAQSLKRVLHSLLASVTSPELVSSEPRQLRRCHIVVLLRYHIPFDPRWMRRDSQLISVADPACLNEVGLMEALESEHLLGAALDEISGDHDPQMDLTHHPLWQLSTRHPRLLLTPHIATQTKETQEKCQISAIRMATGTLMSETDSQ